MPTPRMARSGQGARFFFRVRVRELVRERDAVVRDENVFAVLMDAVRYCSLGQISDTLFEVGGRYRRSM